MSADKTNLIFLISLPRSGSTLTQKILSEHSMICTRSEPWIMLNPLYSLKKTGINAEYDKDLEYVATQDFIEELPDGRKSYIKYLGNAYHNMYQDYISKYHKIFFLDKTPRYYLIIDELQEMFPDAKLILLIRNPLAILSSIINTWAKYDLNRLANSSIDLLKGLDIIIDQISKKSGEFYLLRYEDLLSNQTKTLQECFGFLNIPYEDNVLKYHSRNSDEKWLYGDQVNVYEKKGIDVDNDMKWISSLGDPQHWRLLNDYLHHIGKDKFEIFGYDFVAMENILLKNMPNSNIDDLEENTISLSDLLQTQDEKTENKLKNLKEQNTFLETKINDIQQSKAYRLGQGILKPYRWIEKKFI